MPKPPRRHGPLSTARGHASSWTIDTTIAGHLFTKSFAGDGDTATRAFHSVAARCRHGIIDRVVLWHGTICKAAAGPGWASATEQAARAYGLELINPTPQGPQGPGHSEAYAKAIAQAQPTEMERVCHCGMTVQPFMLRCPDCPGTFGAGKELRARALDPKTGLLVTYLDGKGAGFTSRQKLAAKTELEDLGL